MYTIIVKRTAAVLSAILLMLLPMRVKAADTTIAVQSSASSAVLYEPSSGRVLYEKQAHMKRPMASTTKLMTALLAVELLPQHTVLTATEEALCVEGSSMGLVVGDTISRDDLLRGLLLSSGNDAANVLALTMAGSFEAFADLMNARAAVIGMTDTCFVTPSGLDADGHGSSAYDMALLAAQVLENETLAGICATKSAVIHIGDRQVSLQNHNKLLSQYPDCIGMKTGYTSLAGRCLVSAARRDGVTLIAVTLHCRNDWEEHKTMFDEGFALTERVTLTAPPLGTLTVFGGTSSFVSLTAQDVSTTLLKGDKEQVQTYVVRQPYIWAPVQKGDIVGTVEYRLRGSIIKTVPIKAAASVALLERDSVWMRTKRLFRLMLREVLT